jgi:hypothetical protein
MIVNFIAIGPAFIASDGPTISEHSRLNLINNPFNISKLNFSATSDDDGSSRDQTGIIDDDSQNNELKEDIKVDTNIDESIKDNSQFVEPIEQTSIEDDIDQESKFKDNPQDRVDHREVRLNQKISDTSGNFVSAKTIVDKTDKVSTGQKIVLENVNVPASNQISGRLGIRSVVQPTSTSVNNRINIFMPIVREFAKKHVY